MPMFVMREVLQCKPGKVGDLKKKFRALNAIVTKKNFPPFAILTDVAGEHFWTLVLEMESDSLAAFFAMEEEVMADQEARQAMAGYHDFVVSGRREVFRKDT
jgi:hypothetical protein